MDHEFGKHLQKARMDRGLSVEQAAAAVKIRAPFLRALENSDLTKFPNAAYAKSFLVMYGRFLGVDVKSVAAQIDTTTQMKVEGYQYLTSRAKAQPKPEAEAELAFSMAPPPKTTGTLVPLIVLGGTVAAVVAAFVIWNNVTRLGNAKPAPAASVAQPDRRAAVEPLAAVPPPPTPTPAPPVEKAPVEEAPPRPVVISTPGNVPVPAVPVAQPETEIPKARPISPVAKLAATDTDLLADLGPPKPRVVAPPSQPAAPVVSPAAPVTEESNSIAEDANAIVLEPSRKTWVVVRTGPGGQALFEDYLYTSAKPLRLPAGRYFIELRDADAVEITRGGKRIGYSAPGVVVE